MVDKAVIDKIISDYSQDKIRFLLIFKAVKLEMQNECNREKIPLPKEKELNLICAKITKQLILNDAATPSRIEIRRKIENIKHELRKKQ